MTGNWSERMISQRETETRFPLLREAAVKNLPQMDESLTERHRVQDDGLRVVNCFSGGIILKVPQE